MCIARYTQCFLSVCGKNFIGDSGGIRVINVDQLHDFTQLFLPNVFTLTYFDLPMAQIIVSRKKIPSPKSDVRRETIDIYFPFKNLIEVIIKV